MAGCTLIHPKTFVEQHLRILGYGIKLHPGHFGDLLLHERMAIGFYDKEGFCSDEEIEYEMDIIRSRCRYKDGWPTSEFGWKREFGLIAPREKMEMDKEEIKEKIDLIELFSQFTKLRVVGDHATGRCPLHKDRLPSLSVDRKKRLWNCHAGCGGGDVYAFLMKKYGIDFYQALRAANELTT